MPLTVIIRSIGRFHFRLGGTQHIGVKFVGWLFGWVGG
jgi:hypothetical protein